MLWRARVYFQIRVRKHGSFCRLSSSEPPDVIFQASQERQCCNFEVVERPDPGTQRHGPYRDEEKEIRKHIMEGKSFEDYIVAHPLTLRPKRAISLEDFLHWIETTAIEKYKKYAKRNILGRINNIDLLIFVQSREFFLDCKQEVIFCKNRVFQEFRSVSFFMSPCWCGVIYLREYAPRVLHYIHQKELIYVDNRPTIFEEWNEALSQWLA